MGFSSISNRVRNMSEGGRVLIVLIVIILVGSLLLGKIPLQSKGITGTFEISFVYSSSGGNVTAVDDVSVTADINPSEAYFKASGFSAVLKIDTEDDVTDDVNVTIVLKVGNNTKKFYSESLGDKTITFEKWGVESGEYAVSLDIYVKVTRGNETITDTVFTRSYTVTVP